VKEYKQLKRVHVT